MRLTNCVIPFAYNFSYILYCIHFLHLVARSSVDSSEVSATYKLVHDLFDGYDTRIKPTRKADHPINVTIRMEMYQIVEVNEPKQAVTLNTWLTEYWEDETLHWDPILYDNITELTVPFDVVWRADTTLYNSLVMADDNNRRLLNVRIILNQKNPEKHSSYMELMYPTIYTFSCRLNVLYFPFDSQNCSMIFGSWTFDAASIDYFLYRPSAGMSNYITNAEWNLVSFDAYRHNNKYSCCPNNWTNLHYHLVVQRKPLFFVINLLIPSIIITLISIIGFFTPVSSTGERSEKITLGITTLLAMSILLLTVSDKMPTTSDFVPWIGWYFLISIAVISVGTAMTTVIVVLHQKGLQEEPPPPSHISTGIFLSRLMGVQLPTHLKTTAAIKKSVVRMVNDHLILMQNGSANGVMNNNEECGLLETTNQNHPNTNPSSSTVIEGTPSQGLNPKPPTLSRAAIEWEWMATVFERLNLVIFSVLVLLIGIVMLIAGFTLIF